MGCVAKRAATCLPGGVDQRVATYVTGGVGQRAYSTTAGGDVSLTHLDSQGHAHMVDVCGKGASTREAVASGCITLNPKAFQLVVKPSATAQSKGDVLAVARVAAIMAAKNTPTLIPLCHTLSLSHVSVKFDLCEAHSEVFVSACVRCEGVTGVEMEALTAVTVALLTLYDMTKSAGKGHLISNIQLDTKRGGKSGEYVREDNI